MDLIKELKDTIRMELRLSSQGSEYLEAVISKQDLELLHSLLKKHLGPAAKEPGKEANLSKEIQDVVDALGGLRNEQSFFYRQEGEEVLYAALWPWGSNHDKITLKSGVRTLVFIDQ